MKPRNEALGGFCKPFFDLIQLVLLVVGCFIYPSEIHIQFRILLAMLLCPILVLPHFILILCQNRIAYLYCYPYCVQITFPLQPLIHVYTIPNPIFLLGYISTFALCNQFRSKKTIIHLCPWGQFEKTILISTQIAIKNSIKILFMLSTVEIFPIKHPLQLQLHIPLSSKT